MGKDAEIIKPSGRGLKRWRELYDGIAHRCVYHSPDYIRFLSAAKGWEAELFVVHGTDSHVYYPYLKKPVGELSLVDLDKEYYDVESSWYYGGPLCSHPTPNRALPAKFIDAFTEYAHDSGIVTEFIRFDADIRNHELYPPDKIEYNRETIYAELDIEEEEIFARFTSAQRRAYKKACSAGFELRVSTSIDKEMWSLFEKAYDSEMVRKDAPHHLRFNSSFFDELRRLPDSSLTLVSALKDGDYCGGFIIVSDERYAFHFLSASYPKYWTDRLNNFLFTNAILLSKKQGKKIFDFMGGRPGVFRFKQNFSSLKNKFYVKKSVYNDNVYSRLCRAFADKGDAGDNINHFPPYRHTK